MPVTNQKSACEKLGEFALDVVNGFSHNPKTLSSRWFYDETGSHLFSRITESKDYYPTAREIEILENYSTEIIYASGKGPWKVLELGAGDGRKTEIFLRAFLESHAAESQKKLEFWPIDISHTALATLCDRLTSNLDGLECRPVIGDNFKGLQTIANLRAPGERLCLLFLGSSIGNCSREEVSKFLARLRSYLMPGDLALIGFDLLKEPSRLWRAYSDSEGLTSEFNLNLLRRMNRELGANFDLNGFFHEATWNPHINGMESWLISKKAQTVKFRALSTSYDFRAWEPIHTEISLKFSKEELKGLASSHGFSQIQLYEDANQDFADALWMAAPESVS